jgi:nucleotidyltransferase substrate binding protein (TIGR01987 family)
MKEALSFPNTEPIREAAIQRFEYTFELSWKLMNSLLSDQGMGSAGVKNIIRAAAQLGLIESPTRWFEFAEARNKASHIYKEEVAIEVYMIATSDFCEHVQRLIASAQTELSNNEEPVG